ncbi:MAG: ParB/RepB/Spo0J family partition protein [Deltaproteobacteria bacterium]|nr:ParB/RepB/Spo0J family partition protein [Deltaproteobacteria bacterium]
MQKRPALGKGLGALIPQKQRDEHRVVSTPPEAAKVGALQVPIEDVRPNRMQPRKTFDDAAMEELAASIGEHGLMQPILVRARGNGFEIIAGERRWRACQRAGLKTIEVIVKDLAEQEVFEWALIENIQREDLNPIEEAEAYRRLLETTDMTQERLAVRIGKDRSTIANALRLLKLPDEVRRQVISGALSMGHARALLALETQDEMVKSAREIVKRNLSVREVERLVRAARKNESGAPASTPDPYAHLPGGAPAVQRVTDDLIRRLGTKVRVVAQGRRGRIEIDYASPEELDRLLLQLKN